MMIEAKCPMPHGSAVLKPTNARLDVSRVSTDSRRLASAGPASISKGLPGSKHFNDSTEHKVVPRPDLTLYPAAKYVNITSREGVPSRFATRQAQLTQIAQLHEFDHQASRTKVEPSLEKRETVPRATALTRVPFNPTSSRIESRPSLSTNRVTNTEKTTSDLAPQALDAKDLTVTAESIDKHHIVKKPPGFFESLFKNVARMFGLAA